MSEKVYEVKFHFGTKPISQTKVYYTAAALALAVDILHRLLRLSPQLMWELISIIGDEYNIRIIKEIVLQAPELLQDKIEREVDNAIKDYEKENPTPPVIPDPRWIDVEDGETALGGEMGFSYDFVIDLEDTKNEQD